jgi:restriction endonuclease S subunit
MLSKIVTGSAQGGINSTNLKTLQIPLPPLELQKEIVSKIEKLEERIEKNRVEIERLRVQKREILEKYLEE